VFADVLAILCLHLIIGLYRTCAGYSLPAFDNRFVSDIEQHNVLPSMKWLAYNVIGVRFVINQVCENEIEGELHIEMYTLTLIYRPEF